MALSALLRRFSVSVAWAIGLLLLQHSVLAAPFVFQVEGGTVNKTDTYQQATWDTVNLKFAYVLPIIIAIPNSNGGNPADFRIRNITTTSFELTLAEPPSEDGPHVAMTISYMAMEHGQWTLPDGQMMAAGSILSKQLVYKGGGGFVTVPLPSGFTNPIVFAQIQGLANEQNNLPSETSDPWITASVRNVTTSSFELALDGAECFFGVLNVNEKIAWMAIDGGVTSQFVDTDNVSVIYETIKTSNTITGWDDGAVFLPFSQNYTNPPLFVAKPQTRNEDDGGWIRYQTLSNSGVSLRIDEDECQDGERNHVGEVAGAFAFSESFRMQDPDPDLDGISSALDNCPLVFNPQQEDIDMDGTGDACDCGDGLLVAGELCDDKNNINGDGCTSVCAVEAGWQCVGEPSVCTPICGDGVLLGGEACDDGGTTPGDGCSATCTVETGWECNGQPSMCNTICGDGLIIFKELCDDGNASAGDGCSDSCEVEKGWYCAGQPSVCVTQCGDGLIAGTEQCDDAGTTGGDGCSDSCQIELGWSCTGEPSVCTPGCGDGIIVGSEECDDGNPTDGDGCSLVCTVEPGWQCSGQPSSCVTVCGDGIVAGSEECDDSNTQSGDGCSSDCKIEAVTTGGGMGGAGGASGAGGSSGGGGPGGTSGVAGAGGTGGASASSAGAGSEWDLTGRACACRVLAPRHRGSPWLLLLGLMWALPMRRRFGRPPV
jgi:cysteine-rich repeat protein